MFLDVCQPLSKHPLNVGLAYRWQSAPYLSRGDKWLDLGPRKRHSVLTSGAIWDGAKGLVAPGGTVYCDGTGDYLSLGGITLDIPTTDFTVTWEGNLQTLGGYVGILTNDVSHGMNHSAGDLFLFTTDDFTNQTLVYAAASQLGSHVWSWVLRSTSSEMYRDGVSVSTTSYGATVWSWTGVNIGTTDLGTYNGWLKMMAIHRRVLSAREVAEYHPLIRSRNDPTLNWIDPWGYVQAAAAPGGDAFPFHYYQQMQNMAG